MEGSDAIALLVVRLASDRPAAGDLCWHNWKDAVGAEPDGLTEGAAKYPYTHPPFKRFPGNGSRYFSPHVERALFPFPGQSAGARWIRCPDDLHLDLLQFGQRTARIELLERLTSPIDRGGTLGLIHLSLVPGDEEDVPDTLSWASAIRSPLLRSNNPNSLSLRHGNRESDLESWPLERLVEELFGDPHEDLDRHLYSAFLAPYPPEINGDVEAQRRWRIALATRSYKLDSDRLDNFDPKREERQTLRFGEFSGLVLGNCTVLARENWINGESIRSFRSYWAESLVFGLQQQDAIAEFQRRLAEFGPSPHREKSGRLRVLHDDWLSFRNQLWWSQLSTVADPPQALLPLLQQEQGTGRLFLDLEGDMATYNDLHHRDVEDRQARALANLQVYGSAIAVLSTLGTLYALLDAHGVPLAILLVAALVLSFSVLQLVRAKVDRAS